MPLVARIVFGLCGFALALYAAASLTGNWLSTPPWWERTESHAEFSARVKSGIRGLRATGDVSNLRELMVPQPVRRGGREAISIGVGAVGLTLAGFAVLERRRAEER